MLQLSIQCFTDACIAAQFLVLRGFKFQYMVSPSAAARENFGGIAVWWDLKTLAAPKLLVPPVGLNMVGSKLPVYVYHVTKGGSGHCVARGWV